MSDLKPCPFCGQEVYLNQTTSTHRVYGGRGPQIYAVRCNNNCIYAQYKESPEEAIGNWNHRPTEDKLRAEVKQLQKALKQKNRDLAEHRETAKWNKELRAEVERLRGVIVNFASKVKVIKSENWHEEDRSLGLGDCLDLAVDALAETETE